MTEHSSTEYPESYGSFKRSAGPLSLQESYNQPHTVTKWTSSKTGLQVVYIDIEGTPAFLLAANLRLHVLSTPLSSIYLSGPLCNLSGSVATEVFDDSGCPHTLEHLVFLGSEQYPYKGILDTLANRAFASGTNAWTDTTNTTYTITTAGEEGFLRILPVYLDHVLYPTLKDAGFTTEVYHTNGKGEDGGVVYSEMQGVENRAARRMRRIMRDTLFPKGNGYRSETGGLTGALRVLDMDQIRKYHSSYYLPHNLCLFVTGKLDLGKLLRVLTDQVEPTIERKQQVNGRQTEGWKRPWVETPSIVPSKLEADKVVTSDFPEQDESIGEVTVNWIGPAYRDFLIKKALGVLNAYLSDSSISPLQKELIEIEEPWATSLGLVYTKYSTSVLQLFLSSVPTPKLDHVQKAVKNALKRVLDSGIDVERMTMVLNREQRKLLNTLETDASEALITTLLSDFLFGAADSSDLPESLNDTERYKALQAWSAEEWAELLKKYYVERPSLTVIGKPSAKLANALRKEAETRLADRQKTLGEEGLERLQNQLDEARRENDTEAPPEFISNFKIPDVESIRWINVESAAAGLNTKHFSNEVQKHVQHDTADLPFFLQFEHVQSNFIEILVFLNAAELPKHKDLLTLYIKSFHSLPLVQSDGTRVPYDEVVKLLDTETVDYGIAFGSALSEQLEISIKVDKAKYKEAIVWLRKLLFASEFSVDRLRVTAQKLLQNLPSEKRGGLNVALASWSRLALDPRKSTNVSQQLLARSVSTPAVVDRLKSEPEQVVADLEKLRRSLTSTKRMRIAVVGNILSLESPVSAWKENFQMMEPATLSPVVFGRDCLSELGKNPTRQAVVAPLAAIESSWGHFIAKGLDADDHKDLPALTVANTALNALEGLLWRAIRGAGLPYGARIYVDVERGFMYFRTWRSPDSVRAYIAAKKAVEAMVAGDLMPLDQTRLDSAKSELAYITARSQSTISRAATTSFVNQALKGVSQCYQRDLLAKAQDVTLAEANEVIRKYILPIFDSSVCIAAVACSQGKAEETKTQLQDLGFEVAFLDLNKANHNNPSE
ncbi:zinc metalloprotease [Cystobasidium minutum MCA 4210]|uniref:zinc metalloprotease n=1 Tax=Cystobasidium minutum MCA 4210 TaxID=1397322 RepID=UPI0034CE0CE4|eukprot:jgi/Rhomi1/196227/gm1.4441_g